MRNKPHLELVVSNGIAVERPHAHDHAHQPAPDLKPVTDCGADPTELLALRLIRLVCEAYGRDSLMHVDLAMDTAEAALGPADGTVIVARLTALMRAVRAERSGGFGYISANCPTCSAYITEDERELVALIQAARSGDPVRIARAARCVARGGPAPRIAAMATTLGTLLAQGIAAGSAGSC